MHNCAWTLQKSRLSSVYFPILNSFFSWGHVLLAKLKYLNCLVHQSDEVKFVNHHIMSSYAASKFIAK